MNILGVFHSYADPSAALFSEQQVIAHAEEERFLREKHANGKFPIHAIDYVLKAGQLRLTDVDYIAQAWDAAKYDDGTIQRHYDAINAMYPTDVGDLAYQNTHLQFFRSAKQQDIILRHLRRQYGDLDFPPIRFVNHHLAHACTAFFNSGFTETLVLTIDGSGEDITTVWWLGRANMLTVLREINVPHSLGWLYSALTEYLGFQAYDGEYKVMGLAAYGQENRELNAAFDALVWHDGAGGFETDPMLLSRGPRTYSYYYPDALARHLGRAPRAKNQPIEQWHQDCAFAAQQRLEDIARQMTAYWVERTGIRRSAISGGVGLNVKMNGDLFASGLLDDLFVYPICSDAGSSIGAAMALAYTMGGLVNRRLEHLYVGPEFSDQEIQQILRGCKIPFSVETSIEQAAARLISQGKIVGWFQGRMEGGPRALGARSILADPRVVESRDRVNAVIKYREPWRPFTPSMLEEGAQKYFDRCTHAPFMIMTFHANAAAEREIPAVVHVDKTARPQIVDRHSNPRYFRLLQEFHALTGVPAVLNTSFNVKGEPIVCAPQDALRTFFATGLDALAIGNCLVVKQEQAS